MGEDQQLVYELVERRGYCAGWTVGELLARQVVKLQEELTELVVVSLPREGYWNHYGPAAVAMGIGACVLFDAPKGELDGAWGQVDRYLAEADLDRIGNELADLQVVLFCAAESLSMLREQRNEEPFDLIEAALAKAAGDVERGVRKA